MARNFLTYVIIAIILIQRVALEPMAYISDRVFFIIVLQVIQICVVLWIRNNRNLYNNKLVMFSELLLFYLLYFGLYYILLFDFWKDNATDIYLLIIVNVFITNFELMFYRGYESYKVNWTLRLFIIVPLIIVAILALQDLLYYFSYINRMYMKVDHYYNGYQIHSYKLAGQNYYSVIQFLVVYIIYKIDFILCIKPKKPRTTDFWLNYKPKGSLLD